MLPLYVKSTPAIFKTFLLSAGRYTFFLYFYPTIFVTRGHVCRYAIQNDENRRLFHPHVLKGQYLVGYPQRVVKGDWRSCSYGRWEPDGRYNFFRWGVVNRLFNVSINDISVIYVTAHRCAGGLKKLELRSGSQRQRHFVGFFNVPVLAPTRDHPFYKVIPTHRQI